MFSYENGCIFIQIALKFIHKGPLNNKPVFIQMMAWCQTGTEPLFEPMMT